MAGAYERVAPATAGRLRVLTVGDVEADLDGYRVRVAGHEVHLSLKEFVLLQRLLDNAGRVVGRRELLDVGWGQDYVDPRTHKSVEVYIRRLRLRLGERADGSPRIRTVRGVGYVWDLEPDDA